MNTRWWMTAVAVPAAMLVALVVIPLPFAGDLPDPIATHWGSGGAPNGSMPTWGLVVLTAALFTLVWLVSLAAHRGGTLLAPVAAVLYFLGGLLIAVMVTTMLANRGAVSWTDAGGVGLGTVALVVGVGLVVGAVGWVLAGGRKKVFPEAESSRLPSIDLDADDVGVWMSSGVSLWVPILGLAGLVAAIVIQGGTGVLLGAVGLVLLAVAAVRVVVGPEGVTIGLGWWGWPRRHIPLDEIARAEVLQVEPLSYGGWGYRIVTSQVLTNARAIVVRRGPGIRLVRDDRPDLIVTVDDAERGAGLINELLSRRGLLHAV
jgi:hypothetical protein